MQNNLLHLNKTFFESDRELTSFSIALYKSADVVIEDLQNLYQSLINVKNYWDNQYLLDDLCLVSVYCKGIVSKTNRIAELFKFHKTDINDLIVGARFDGDVEHSHIFTYCISKEDLDFSLKKFKYFIDIFSVKYGDRVSKQQLTELNNDKKCVFIYEEFRKSKFIKLVEELSYVARFDTYFCRDIITDNTIVTLFDTNKDIINLLQRININISNDRVNSNNVLLLPDEFLKLKEAAPYLISMAVSDFSLADLPESNDNETIKATSLEGPKNEPIIGVIDTLFNKDAYFSNWVDYREEIDTRILKPSPEDYGHGTAVSSLIVDLPNINPSLDDGCGHFRVRHFGVALKHGGITTFKLLKKIETIVSTNRDIHVWNLSLGSPRPINENFISPEASIIDMLQVKYPDIIFVIAGTNTKAGQSSGLIGAPADSINSLVVNSVRRSDLRPASYSRSGPALSFFIKPDVSYYGGDYDEPLNVCYPYKIEQTWGTSLAAPLISRKVAYMMEVLKIPRACAKALIIDSAVGWQRNFDLDKSNLIGRGIVPIDINDIVKSKDNEIKFYVEGESNKYKTREYDLPVPLNKEGKFPYVARATLCYFSHCSRNQGVDYTDTELNLKFGRTRPNAKRSIEPIDKDYQDTHGYFIKEKDARGQFRKWDNVKVVTDTNISKKQAKTNFGRDNWGLEVTYSRRYETNGGVKKPQSVKWGLVITLCAIDGRNRYDEFIRLCKMNEWRVYSISIENMVEVYNQSQLDIEFDDN